MSYEVTGRRRPTKVKKQIRQQKRGRDDVDATKLQKAVDELVSPISRREVGYASLGSEIQELT